MPDSSNLFGDLLALARRSWVQEMAARLKRLGFDDYRRSDAIVLRWLRRGQTPLGELTGTLGVTRQASRKAVDGLISRGYARVARDSHDARRRTVELTAAGAHYAQAVVETVGALNAEFERHTDPDDLAVVKSVLRAVSTLYGNE